MKSALRLVLCAFCVLLRPSAGFSAPAPATTPQPPPDDPLKRIELPLEPPARVPFEGGRFSLRPGEVIVFTGPAQMVFEQQQGWLETMLAVSAKEQRPILRHMSWEGDTVYEQHRHLNFGSWKEQFEAVRASTIFTWFGQMEALDDARSVEDFERAYTALLDEFIQVTPRVVVLGPLPFLRPASPHVPDNTARNDRVKAHTDIARRLAARHGLVFIDLHATYSQPRHLREPMTENGVHLTEHGQQLVSDFIAKALGVPTGFPKNATALQSEIVAKNRHWFDAWRTMNWAFAYGDRTTQLFGQGIAGHPKMAAELEQFKPLIATADARIHALALGKEPPPMTMPTDPLRGGVRGGSPESPEVERRTFKVREGFDVNLFASEADGLVKPLQIRWDSQGRLWAACTPSYPQIVPGVPPDDYLLVCEDTDGDGRADKFTKFAEGLLMPMGMEFGDGGVYVCESTQLIHLRDTDGEGKADERRVILSGFGTGDSHQLINSLRWGPDGRLWFSQGLHIDARVETPWGIAAMDKAGLWRFNPRTLRLHDFFGGAVAGANCWGVAFDDWGQVFHIAADNRMAFYSTPGLIPVETPERYYEIGALAVSKVKGMELEILGSRHLPDDLQGALVKSTYFMNSVLLFKLVDDGSGFRTEDLGELISSSETAFRPVETKQGPDGAIYVCDWFNPVIGHYQASYRDPNRDKVHGRIWRLTTKDRPLVKPPKPARLKTPELVDVLLSGKSGSERWITEQARQELFHRPKRDVIKAVDAWLARHAPAIERTADVPVRSTSAAANTATSEERALETSPVTLALREAISLYAAHEEHRGDVLQRLLAAPDPRLRAWGTRFVGLWADHLPDPLALVSRMIADPHPRVRLEAVVAASYIPQPQAIEIAVRALDQPRDRFIDYALRQCARALLPQWQPALASGQLTFGGNAGHLAFIVQADAGKESIGHVRQLLERARLDRNVREGLLVALVNAGEADDLAFALEKGSSLPVVLDELATVAHVRNQRPSGDLTAGVQSLLDARNNTLRTAGLRLAAAWKTAALAPQVQAIAVREGEDTAVRAAAVESLAALMGANAVAELATFAASSETTVARAAIRALAPLDVAAAAGHAAKALAAARTDDDAAALLQSFLARQGGTDVLGKALAATPPSADGAKLALQALGTLGRDEPALREVLYRAAGLLVTAPPEYSAELVARLIADARTKGNAYNGSALFRSAVTACVACHKIGSEGGETGPDLSAIGRGMTPELIVESVLWPRRQIKEGYFLTQVTTGNGGQHQGYIQSENATELVLRDPATGVDTRLRKPTIKERHDTGTLMPEGLTAALTGEQVRDLLRYLLELGK